MHAAVGKLLAKRGKLGAQGVVRLALQARQGLGVAMRVLLLGQQAAHGLDHVRITAEIEGTLPAVVAEGQAVVGPVAASGHMAPGGHDHALPSQETAACPKPFLNRSYSRGQAVCVRRSRCWMLDVGFEMLDLGLGG